MSEYQLPGIELLNKTEILTIDNNDEYIKKIEKVLKDYKVQGEVVDTSVGPLSLEFEIKPKPGTRINKILDLKQEFAFYLGNNKIELLGPRDNKTTIGIKIPNPDKYDITFREVIESNIEALKELKIPYLLGRKDTGEIIFGDVTKTPHIIIGGYSGSGKTTLINTIISTILMTKTPKEVNLAIIDQKAIDLTMYNGIPHLIFPVVLDTKKSIVLLNRILQEMENRYSSFASSGNKTIEKYNEYVEKKNKEENIKIGKMPYLLVIIDWLDEIMLQNKKEAEDILYRLLERGDEVGIHFIIATQRPDNSILTNVIKERLETKISFAVRSEVDSKIILGKKGAEKISSIGEMIYKPLNSKEIIVKGAIITDNEIKRLIDWIVKQEKVDFDKILNQNNSIYPEHENNLYEENDDPLYNDIVDYVVTTKKASASIIQRKFKLGYNRAARLIDLLEERGIIGPANGSSPREVLIGSKENEEQEPMEETEKIEIEEHEERTKSFSDKVREDINVLTRFAKDMNKKRKAKRCPNCRKRITHDTNYCINCGYKLK